MSDKHTPEPWWDESGTIHAKADNWTEKVHSCDHPAKASSDANARRIVACVNACAGLSNAVLEAIADVESRNRAAFLQTFQQLEDVDG